MIVFLHVSVGDDLEDDIDTGYDSGRIGGKASGDDMGDDVNANSDDASRGGEGKPSEDRAGGGCAIGGAVGSMDGKGSKQGADGSSLGGRLDEEEEAPKKG